MYKPIRIARIAIALRAMVVPTMALLCGYDSVFVRMQILTAILSGAALCLVFWAAVTLVYGRIYCSTVCPLGTTMDCISAVARLSRRRRRAYRYRAPSPRTRLAFLFITLLTLLSGSALVPTLLDPYSAYARIVEELVARPLGLPLQAVAFTGASLTAAIATAAGIIAVAWSRGRLACNTVCPVGTILGTASRKSYFHIEIDPDRCTLCGECERVCKAQCIKLPERLVDTSRCVVCFDCTAACPNAAISYKAGRYRLDMPMMQSLRRADGNTSAAGSGTANASNCKNTGQ